MVGHDVHDDFQAGCMCGGGELVEVVHGAEFRVDVAVVIHVIAAVRQLAGVERAEPDGVHAEVLEVADLFGDALDIAQAGTGGVFERSRVYLIHHGLLPPQCRVGCREGGASLVAVHAISFSTSLSYQLRQRFHLCPLAANTARHGDMLHLLVGLLVSRRFCEEVRITSSLSFGRKNDNAYILMAQIC